MIEFSVIIQLNNLKRYLVLVYTVESKKITLSNFFLNPNHIEAEYSDGFYKTFNSKYGCKNIWNSNRWCKNVMEMLFNNSDHPCAEFDKKKGKKLPFLDGSGANQISNLGSMKEIWKEFERERHIHYIPLDFINLKRLEKEFWSYYIKNYSDKFQKSSDILFSYIKERRKKMTDEDKKKEKDFLLKYSKEIDYESDDFWRDVSKDFLKHLIYKTPKGYLYELILLGVLKDITGGEIIESNIENERKGIDGFIRMGDRDIPISLKPKSYRNSHISPVNNECLIIYEEDGSDLLYRTAENLKFFAD